ncbi:MAG: hypothetical protein U5N27_19795 [Rhizobium sp.]|nr:hypothetical protein [Rhizobium sp.]
MPDALCFLCRYCSSLFRTIAVGLSIHVMRAEFDEVFDSALQETTERLAPLVIDDFFRRDTGTGPDQVAALNPGATDEYPTYQVRDASGRVLLHPHNVGAEPYAAPLLPGFWSGDDRRIFTIADGQRYALRPGGGLARTSTRGDA